MCTQLRERCTSSDERTRHTQAARFALACLRERLIVSYVDKLSSVAAKRSVHQLAYRSLRRSQMSC